MNPDPTANGTVKRLLDCLEPRIDLKHVDQVSAKGSIGIHFRGNGQHQVDNLLDILGVDCLHLGDPEKMNLDSLYQRASDLKVPLEGLAVPELEFTAEKISKRFPSGAILVHRPKTQAQAREFLQCYSGGGS